MSISTRLLPVLVFVIIVPAAVCEGVLSLGSPTFKENAKKEVIVTFPVILEGDVGSGVAALDFTFKYDPKVLAPQGASAGAASIQGGKDVAYSAVGSGEYVVIVFGLNQSTIQGGKVAEITLRKVGPADGTETNVSIEGTTLASLAGQTIASKGSSAKVTLGSTPTDPTDPTDTPPPAGDDGAPSTPGPPAPSSSTSGDTPATPPSDEPSRTPALSVPSSAPMSNSAAAVSPTQGPGWSGTGLPRTASRSDAAARLSQLKRAAREFERRRAALPTPQTGVPVSGAESGPGTDSSSENPQAGPDAPRNLAQVLPPSGAASPQANPAPARLSLTQGSTPSAEIAASSASLSRVPPAAASGSIILDPRMWAFGGVVVVLAVGILLRRRLFS